MASGSLPDANPPLIVCAGIAVIDHVFRVQRFPQEATKSRAKVFASVGGGCAANAAVAAKRLGARVQLAAPLGGPAGIDIAGDAIIARLEQEGIACDGVRRLSGVSSPVSAVLVDASGERTIINYRDDALAEVRCEDPDALIARADAVLIDNRFPEFSLPVARAARAQNRIVVMDADEPTRHTGELLSASSHVVFSADGLRATAQQDDLATALSASVPRTQALLAVTDGARGVIWIEQGNIKTMPAYLVKAVDTLGAGDVFHGACVLALAEGASFEQALAFAAAAAAVKCTRFGGIAGAPRRAEVGAFLRSLRA